MSKLRSVSTAFWSDPFIEDLTPNQKLLYLYLITNDKTNMLGIYEVSVKKMAFETSIKKDEIERHLKAFETLRKVKYIENYVVLVNYMKHQNFNTNMKKSAIDIYNNLPIILKDNGVQVSKSNPLEGFESLLNYYGMVPKVEVEYEVESQLELEEEIEEEIKEEPENPSVYSKEVHLCFDYCVLKFEEKVRPNTPAKKDKWLECIDRLNKLDGYPFKHIQIIVNKSRSNWRAEHFNSLLKLRRTDSDGVKYVVLFKATIKADSEKVKAKELSQDGIPLIPTMAWYNHRDRGPHEISEAHKKWNLTGWYPKKNSLEKVVNWLKKETPAPRDKSEAAISGSGVGNIGKA